MAVETRQLLGDIAPLGKQGDLSEDPVIVVVDFQATLPQPLLEMLAVQLRNPWGEVSQLHDQFLDFFDPSTEVLSQVGSFSLLHFPEFPERTLESPEKRFPEILRAGVRFLDPKQTRGPKQICRRQPGLDIVRSFERPSRLDILVSQRFIKDEVIRRFSGMTQIHPGLDPTPRSRVGETSPQFSLQLLERSGKIQGDIDLLPVDPGYLDLDLPLIGRRFGTTEACHASHDSLKSIPESEARFFPGKEIPRARIASPEVGRVLVLEIRRLADGLQSFDEIIERFGRHHDGIPATPDVLRDFHELPAIVLLQIEKENLSLCHNFLRVNRIIIRATFLLFVTDHYSSLLQWVPCFTAAFSDSALYQASLGSCRKPQFKSRQGREKTDFFCNVGTPFPALSARKPEFLPHSSRKARAQ